MSLRLISHETGRTIYPIKRSGGGHFSNDKHPQSSPITRSQAEWFTRDPVKRYRDKFTISRWQLQYLKDFQIPGTPRARHPHFFKTIDRNLSTYFPKIPKSKKNWNIWTWKGEQIEIDEFLAKQWGKNGSGMGQGWRGSGKSIFRHNFQLAARPQQCRRKKEKKTRECCTNKLNGIVFWFNFVCGAEIENKIDLPHHHNSW